VFEIKIVDENTVEVSGQCELNDLQQLRNSLEQRVEACEGRALHLDMGKFTSVSSAVLSVILCLLRHARAHQCELKILSMPPKLYDMARVGGLEAIIPSEAVAS